MSSIRHVAGATHNPVAQLAADHPGVVKIGRAGWFAKGVVYTLAGVLALMIAVQAQDWTAGGSTVGDQEASPIGAIKTVAGSTGGPLLLWLLAAGMLIYAAWRIVTALLPGGTDVEGWAHRIGYVASAVMYSTFAFNAIVLALHGQEEPDGNKTVSHISHRFLGNFAGRAVIGIAGVIVMAVGLYRVSKGVRMDMEDELDMSSTSPAWRRWIERLGAVGEIGRGIGFALVGFFLLRAAITYDSGEATGLDGALRRLATSSWGIAVVAVVGIGFAAYGIFCLATFIHRRLQAP